MRRTFSALSGAISFVALCAMGVSAQAEGWCSGKNIVVFSGGPSGGTFNSIIDKGALQAAADTGATVNLVYSDWNFEQMVTQFRDMIGQKPDGIAMMGHPGDAALMPLAEEAQAAGIKVMYMNVDVPEVRAKTGSGFVGASLYKQGEALAAETIRLAGDKLKPGDTAIIMSRWEAGNRAQRELGLADALEKWGMKVIKLQEADGASADQMLQLPVLTSAVLSNPGVKLIGYPGGPWVSAAPVFMESMGIQPGQIIGVGFDIGQGVKESLESGHMLVTADQQPYQQGYLPVLSLCQQLVYKLAPLNVDTGSGFVTADNVAEVADLANQGFR